MQEGHWEQAPTTEMVSGSPICGARGWNHRHLATSLQVGITMYRRTGFNCECLIIADCEFLPSTHLLQSQSALLVYKHMRKPYAHAIFKYAIRVKMLERN